MSKICESVLSENNQPIRNTKLSYSVLYIMHRKSINSSYMCSEDQFPLHLTLQCNLSQNEENIIEQILQAFS